MATNFISTLHNDIIGFWYLATQKDLEFQPAVVATTSFVFLALGLLVSI